MVNISIPIYKPQRLCGNRDSKDYYWNSSSHYGSKSRSFILNRDKKCMVCGSESNLQVDHIYSIYLGWTNKIALEKINNVENLQCLCAKCNSSKAPEEYPKEYHAKR